MTATKTRRIEVDMAELERILERARTGALREEDHEKLRAAIETLGFLTGEIERKGTTIAELRKLLFGSKSEKSKDVLDASRSGDGGGPSAAGDEGGEGMAEDQEPSSEESPGSGDGEGAHDDPASQESPQADDGEAEEPKKKRKGHGRNGADDYEAAETIELAHGSLKSGDACPVENCDGRVYRLKRPKVIIRIRAEPPLRATRYELEQFRCGLCGTVFTACAPEGMGDRKYDESAAAMIACLHYGSGFPFSRLEKLQGNLGIPLAASTQWELVEKAAAAIRPVYEELLDTAAQGEIVHNDDTPMKILETIKDRKRRIHSGEDPPERKGVYTSGVISRIAKITIALFFTGLLHAGENLTALLRRRREELAEPIQCDALAQNVPKEFETILSNCLVHARRNFVKVIESFPEECRFVLETLAVVFRNDALARQRGLSAAERLEFHRSESMRPMATLRLWMQRELKEKRVERNSGLGRAMAYMRKHWRKLTRFLYIPGAPLENNVVERGLKMAIRHRRNSLFYKTQNGAWVGDVFMSLIHTAELAGENPFAYLCALLRHAEELPQSPEKWLPWNYRETLAGREEA